MPRAKTPRNNTSLNKQVISMPEVTAAPQIRKSAGSGAPTPIDLEVQIRQRAYELYEERGCAPGQETEDWFRAEREVLARTNHQQSA
ncbi:MAG TPA: DUF2934 domain-containing protein [Terriglobales bacterium]|nr:DUF2934 domain-containing protein [Terriglobales bacterium]